MREQPDFSDEFRGALSKVGYNGAELDRIERRRCGSDDYTGVEYSFYGSWIPIRAIVDVMSDTEDFAIESMSLIDESADVNELEPHLNVFVADLREQQPHPAFIGEPY